MVMNLDDGSNLNVNETAMTDWAEFDGHFQLRQFQSCISYSQLPCHCTTWPSILSSISLSSLAVSISSKFHRQDYKEILVWPCVAFLHHQGNVTNHRNFCWAT